MPSMATKYDYEEICETRVPQPLNPTNTWGTGIKVAADGMYPRGERDPNQGILW